MKIPLEPGMTHTIEDTVRPEWTIAHYDKNLPPVLSTPAMIGLMEWAASEVMRPHLPPGSISVGTHINVKHLASAWVGAKIRATARFRETDGRFYVFEAEVEDGQPAAAGQRTIGRGTVTRAIVERARLQQTAETK